ncbi:MAG: hypothetical protein ACREDF_05890 [Thermoplasmata archaeon]
MVRRSLWYLFASIVLGLLAIAGALDDVDFFNRQDFYDRTELHHEHIVVFVSVLVPIMLFAAGVSYLRELRVFSVDRQWDNGRERV